MRKRSETIGQLGRAPARKSIQPPRRPPTVPPPEPPAERSAIARWVHAALFDNLALKSLSMILAITVFLLVNTNQEQEISARVGVSYTLPDDRVLVSERLEEVRVTIKGSYSRLRHFDERELERINIDLRRESSGDVPIGASAIKLPAGLHVTSVSPKTVHVQFDRRVEKIVDVTPQLAGRPMHGYVVAEVKATPSTLRVRGAAGTLAALSAVHTREVSVEGRTESFSADTDAVTPDGVEPVGTPRISLQVAIDEELVTRRLPGIVVGIGGEGVDSAISAAKWSVTPAQVEVTLTGTVLAIEKAKAGLTPMVKLSANDTKAREVAVSVEGLPPGVGIKISPERVRVSPVHPAPAAPTVTP